MELNAENVSILAAAIASQMKPVIPLSIDLWGVAEIALYLKMSESNVRQRIVCLPGFPQAIRLPTGQVKPHPRWKATEVITWVSKYQECRIA